MREERISEISSKDTWRCVFDSEQVSSIYRDSSITKDNSLEVAMQGILEKRKCKEKTK